MIYKHKYSGLSLLELKTKYGTGSKGFYDTSWWLDQDFAEEKPEIREYEINLGENLVGLNYTEQLEKLSKGFEPIHPAVLADFILAHYAKTKERLLENNYARTSSLDSDGHRVDVGNFDQGGLSIDYDWGGHRYGPLGLSSSLKLPKLETRKLEIPESLNLEIQEIKINGKVYILKQ